MMFYLKCPLCDEWKSTDFDESYRHLRYRLDCTEDFKRHYLRVHHLIPLPEVVDT